MTKSAERASRPYLASDYRIRRFVCEHALADRPHTSMWLAKTYVILLACMVTKYEVLLFCWQAGGSLARCLCLICIF